MVVAEQTTETFAAFDVTACLADVTATVDQFVAEPLMVAAQTTCRGFTRTANGVTKPAEMVIPLTGKSQVAASS